MGQRAIITRTEAVEILVSFLTKGIEISNTAEGDVIIPPSDQTVIISSSKLRTVTRAELQRDIIVPRDIIQSARDYIPPSLIVNDASASDAPL